ncbi:MAG: membrane protein insertion efficiency factor YidD [Gammaproteobacteria bacterium]|nr:membrane protein insertion efficiency factor YidD [Gammaproteobacteria bacterium]
MARLIRLLLRGYQLVISPLIGPHCRHIPTCSNYALEAVERFGAWKGGRLALARLMRCHPWGTSGYDPVPKGEDHQHACGSDGHDHH